MKINGNIVNVESLNNQNIEDLFSCGNKNRNKEIETCGNRASSTPHVNRRSASRNRKSRSVERTNKNSNSSSGQKKSEITNRRIDELTGVNDIRAYLSKLENTVFTDPFRRKKSEEGKPSMEEDAGTSEDAVWGAGAQTERTTSEGRLRRASENSTRRSDCGSTGKVSASEDQFIRMPHAVGSPGCARGSATIWRNCVLPTDGVGEGDEQLLRGCCYNKPLLVPGGRAFVWPTIQCVQRISLNTMTLQVESPTVYTSQGVPISVTGIAQVKIQGQNEEMLLAACEQFLGKQEHEIQHIALVTLEGHQRAIMGSMTVEEIYKDRKKFSKQVFEVASSDLVNMGITVVSYTLKDIRDEEGYLKSLGMARTAEVKRDARIGEAEARRDAQIKEAIAEEERMAARFLNDTEIAKAQRDFELKKAAYDVEVQTKKAEAEMAYELQAAKTKQRIKEEQMQILVVERSQEISVQDQEIQRRERELEATIRRPAEAEKYKLEKLAEANRNRVILEAEAEAEALRVRGEAEAFAIEAKARAEAEQMAKKADAWKDYKEAAMVDMLLDTLPKVAAEVAAPLSQAKKITMVSSGQGDIGAAKLTGEVLSIVSKVPEVVKNLTGVDIVKSIHAA
ncbi:flotillin-1 isoform X1 [Periplaneta americana]|uniref:flotillin-1 isoform X1 n=1 Tax=Periplaneta americana TaxID=6978 RepID=UPI0037E72664